MVHALHECWRVLEPEGALIDLRPFHSNPPLEVITDGGVFVAGPIDDEGGAPDDIAADQAMVEVVRRGYFALELQDSFKFASYWDTLQGLLDHAAESWHGFSYVPSSVVNQAQQIIAAAGSSYRLRIPRSIHIAMYSKLDR